MESTYYYTETITVEPGDSKLKELVNFLLFAKFSNHIINNMIDSKHLAIVNIFAPLKMFTKARFDCIKMLKQR